MAKILVADDNSNVQKTVALALADLGVEVVAVNNGEAAVRKFADIAPNLVLADIFMPVRNGYEVCEFIKRDSRFSHIPVVLLVGAFDPLDEREAQRVSADGILKKPFVPPDPLIAMVKTLLNRSLGDRLVGVGGPNSAVITQSKPVKGVPTEEHPAATEHSEEMLEEKYRPQLGRVAFGEGERPIAFGQLLEPPAPETTVARLGVAEHVDNEQIMTSSRDASLGDPIFWKSEEPKPETEEENSGEGEDASSEIPVHHWTPDEEAVSRAEAEYLQPVETFELVREETDDGAEKAPTIVESSPLIVQDAASQASLTVEGGKAEDLAANPIEWMASVPPPRPEETGELAPDWSAAIIGTTDEDSTAKLEPDDSKTAPAPYAPEASAVPSVPASVSLMTPEPTLSPAPVQPSMKTPSQSAEDTARSISKQDLADLAASLQAKPSEPVSWNAKPLSDPAPQHPAVTTKAGESAPINTAPPVSKTPAQSVEDTARSIPKQYWADMAATLQAKPIEPVVEKPKRSPIPIPQPPASNATKGDSVSVDSVPKPPAQSVEDTARSIPKRDWVDMTASLEAKASESIAEKLKLAPTPPTQPPSQLTSGTQPGAASITPNPAPRPGNAEQTSGKPDAHAAPDPALVEAVVQRVLDKMKPQVVDIITKEFLRPVVQALVHREVTKR